MAGATDQLLGRAGRGRFEFLLPGHLLGLGDQDLDGSGPRDSILPDLAVDDELAVALAGRDPQVHFARLPGPVDDAPNDPNADGSFNVDFGPLARWKRLLAAA